MARGGRGAVRREFPAKVRVAAFERADGRCEYIEIGPGDFRCTAKLVPGNLFYDHIIPDGLGGEPTLENCQCLCKAHHDPKTRTEDVPRIAKMKRQRRNYIGAKPPSRWPKRVNAWR